MVWGGGGVILTRYIIISELCRILELCTQIYKSHYNLKSFYFGFWCNLGDLWRMYNNISLYRPALCFNTHFNHDINSSVYHSVSIPGEADG